MTSQINRTFNRLNLRLTMISDNISCLYSNGLKIPFNPDFFEKMSPTYMTDKNLKERFNENGYLYIPSFFESSTAFNLRESYFNLFGPTIFKENTTRREGIFSGILEYAVEQHGLPAHPAAKFVRSNEFNSFVNDKRFSDLATLLLNDKVKMLQRKPLRHFYPNTHKASRVHIDYSYLTEGSEKFVTIWIPLGDISSAEGGLVYLKNSHKLDFNALKGKTVNFRDRPQDDRPISNNLKVISEITGLPWLWSEFKGGDILVHSPFLVHASLDLNSSVMRLSTDIRFASGTLDQDHRWSKDWLGNDGL